MKDVIILASWKEASILNFVFPASRHIKLLPFWDFLPASQTHGGLKFNFQGSLEEINNLSREGERWWGGEGGRERERGEKRGRTEGEV